MERNIVDFIETHVASVSDLEAQLNLAEWRYRRHGRGPDERTIEEKRQQIEEIFANRENFARVRTYDDEGLASEDLTQRQIHVMRLRFARAQIPTETRSRSRELIEEISNVAHTYRVAIDDEELTLFEVDDIFENSEDAELREAVWGTTLEMGEDFGEHMVRLVGIRNRAARDLGYDDFYRMMLELKEVGEDGLLALVKKVVRESDAAYDKLKNEIDEEANRRFKLRRAGVMPWHYGDLFFRRMPVKKRPDFDRYFEGVDHVGAARALFASMGFDVDPILQKSDLDTRSGMAPEIRAIHMDRRGQDVRLVGQLGDDEASMQELIGALARALYYRGLHPDLPYLLREPGHELLLEGTARIFSSLSRDPVFLGDMVGGNKSSITRNLKALGDLPRQDGLLKCRWLPAFIYFERALYENPGRDLQRIWWDLVEIFQKIRVPPNHAHGHDWACNLDIAEDPISRQNDFLADLIAAQFRATFLRELGPGLVGNAGIGPFLNEKLFALGNSRHWRDLVAQATGAKLDCRHLLAEILG
ncbi:MAG: M2 family metallopeptidase [Planctomycetes bacterium]|nr:M2 family metallopeptidase [Planctomycetota bacterium]